jgi:hypothetical protein
MFIESMGMNGCTRSGLRSSTQLEKHVCEEISDKGSLTLAQLLALSSKTLMTAKVQQSITEELLM